jgi:hypothetical protein
VEETAALAVTPRGTHSRPGRHRHARRVWRAHTHTQSHTHTYRYTRALTHTPVGAEAGPAGASRLATQVPDDILNDPVLAAAAARVRERCCVCVWL